MTPEFWSDKSVFLTGHTGFKGSWAAALLHKFGAQVHGYSTAPQSVPALFDMTGDAHFSSSTIADLSDTNAIKQAINNARPDIVLHMAAQPLVRKSYKEPVETFASNVMGTVHLLEELRTNESLHDRLQACLIITSDKVYENAEDNRAFLETDRLGGHDPYAASKAATEIAVKSYRLSYFEELTIPVLTARGGNVIGGGDFSEDRLVPDIIRAEINGSPLTLRNPQATRPWQHVIDCLSGYFTYLEQASPTIIPSLNFGPHDPNDVLTVAEVQSAFANAMGSDQDWQPSTTHEPHEMETLSIDSTAAWNTLGWRGKMTSLQAVKFTAQWYGNWQRGDDPFDLMNRQIDAYLKDY